jgi:hypothetical protein
MLALSVLLASAAPRAVASPSRPFVSIEQAKSLAYEALTGREKRLPGLAVEISTVRSSARYIYASAYWGNPLPEGSAVVTNLAIDRRTGDVWDAATACDEIVNPRLQKLQARVRRQLGLSATDYTRVKTRGPICDD